MTPVAERLHVDGDLALTLEQFDCVLNSLDRHRLPAGGLLRSDDDVIAVHAQDLVGHSAW
jgi:hypothetical protein